MTTKRTPTKDQREFAAYVRAMDKREAGLTPEHVKHTWRANYFGAIMFRAGVAYGRRSRAK